MRNVYNFQSNLHSFFFFTPPHGIGGDFYFTVTEDMLQKFNVSMYNKPQDQTQEEQVEGILDHLDMDDDNVML